MIQRIQSLFLLLTSAGFFSLFKFPFASSQTSIPVFMSDQVYNIYDHVILLVMTGLGGLLSALTVFMFQNRTLQLKLNQLLIVVSLLLPLVSFLLFFNEGKNILKSTAIEDEAGLYILLGVVLFSFLSYRYIQKDQNLVESMDRLR
ncbi:MAG: DUF4293 family protein [Saprospiraceae bacterium]